jgi:hypothetical protein
MRQGQQKHYNNNKQRMRGRNQRKGPNPLTRSYESNGGDVKIRGTALHIAEKYVQLARDAQSSGDRVAGENYLQHAEHYYRLVAAAQAQMPQPQPVVRSDGDNEMFEDERDPGNGPYQQGGGDDQPSFGGPEPQPYMNGNGGQPQQGEEGQRYNNNNHNNNNNNNSNNGQQHDPQQNRFDNRGGNDYGENRGRDRGDFRGRRRRPYRDRFQDQGAPRADTQQDAGPPPPSDAPQGED